MAKWPNTANNPEWTEVNNVIANEPSNYEHYMLNSTLTNANDTNKAILDSGATSNFFTTDAPVKNIQLDKQPILVKIPNGKQLQSTHTCNLNIPGLPPQATKGHLIPGMKGHSLVSLVQLCNAGCVTYMDERNS